MSVKHDGSQTEHQILLMFGNFLQQKEHSSVKWRCMYISDILMTSNKNKYCCLGNVRARYSFCPHFFDPTETSCN